MTKKKGWKRISVFLLSLIVALSTMAGAAFAGEVQEEPQDPIMQLQEEPDNQEEPENQDYITVIGLDGTSRVITKEDIESAASIEGPLPKLSKGTVSEITGTFYSVKEIFSAVGIDVSDLHGFKAVGGDGFTTGFDFEDFDNIYIYELNAPKYNSIYGMALKAEDGSATPGAKWPSGVVTISLEKDHIWFVKDGSCHHYCSVCGEAEPLLYDDNGNCTHVYSSCKTEAPKVVDIVDKNGTTVEIHECELKAAASVNDTFTYNTTAINATYYSLKSLLENANFDVSEVHGITAIGSDGFTTGYNMDEFDQIYLYDCSKAYKEDNTVESQDTMYRTAINGSEGKKWASKLATIKLVKDHVWFVKNNSCKHYCSICGEAEPAFEIADVDGTKITIHSCELEALEGTETTMSFGSGEKKTETTAVYYRLKDLFENAGIEAADIHGFKVVASDGFTTGFTPDDFDNLYIYEMGSADRGGQAAGAAGTFGTALDGSAGNKWAKDFVSVELVKDHVWFVKGNSCKHYCSVCGEAEPLAKDENGFCQHVYSDCKAAEPVAFASWKWNGVKSAAAEFQYTICNQTAASVSATVNDAVTQKATPEKAGVRTYTATAVHDGTTYTDGKTEAIAKAEASLAKKTAVYTGKTISPAVTVKSGTTALKNGTDYTVSYQNNTNAGTATATISLKGSTYSGTITQTFTISKAAQKLKVTQTKAQKTKNVSLKKVKKKAQTIAFSKIAKVTGKKVKAAFTYKKVSGNKKFSVNPKTGKITIKKGLKKGTYTLKIKVTAKADKNYKAASKTVAVKIKVK